MARGPVLAIFGAIGFAIGFLSFLAAPLIANWVPSIVIDQALAFATISGAAGAAISTTVVSLWARRP
ncbi:MAG: hypothetical protein QXX64_03865 [Nitrososphaera sp.]|uniref:hypothetical protein n=1 Tax=Candidatus Nitrososphaera gargensis TaxID=497727 RepID=UPI0011E55A3C|nr:hypothetical protein [Candidatus Nitrososphaera gargensis]